ncbi:hypothetical protein [Ohtaekwangia sp.]|uniref:hypothetical protein n=1 Tax=Ohtaekwangia sp. TaxID=2066019 RepID=UPI002FDCFC92
MKQSDSPNASLAKSMVEAGVDIKLMIKFIDLTLNKTYSPVSSEQEIMERIHMKKFLTTLREIEKECPWVMFDQDIKLGDDAMVANVVKLIKLLA